MRLTEKGYLRKMAMMESQFTMETENDKKTLFSLIESAPTINPEDLRPKGEWIRPTKINGRSFNIPHCSVCEGVPCGVDENTRYCPNCGAKMEGKSCD